MALVRGLRKESLKIASYVLLLVLLNFGTDIFTKLSCIECGVHNYIPSVETERSVCLNERHPLIHQLSSTHMTTAGTGML